MTMRGKSVKFVALLLALALALPFAASVQPAHAAGTVTEIVVSQGGYTKNDYKMAYVLATDALTDLSFRVWQGTTVRYTGTLQDEGVTWGKRVYSADFSAMAAYQGADFKLTSNSVESYLFPVQPNIWSDYLDEMTSFYRIQRKSISTADAIPSGYSDTVPSAKAYHAAGHLDDGMSPDGTTFHDLSGGWYDAGDYGQYGGNQWVAGEIALAYLRHAGNPVVAYDYDLNGIPDLLDEAKWGADFVIRQIDAFGGPLYRLRTTTDPAFNANANGWKHPEFATDGDPNTTGDNRIATHYDVGGAAKGAGMLAAVARAFDQANLDPTFVTDATNAAVIAYQYALTNVNDDSGSYRARGGVVNPLLWAEVELYKLTGDPAYKTAATSRVSVLSFADLQSTNYWDMRPMALAEFYPDADATTQAKIQDLLKQRVDYFMSTADDNPYGVLNEFKDFGVNEPHASYLGDLMRYYELFGDPAVLRAVKKGLYWVFGANPWNISWISGIGTDYTDFIHTRLDEEAYDPTNTGIVIPGAMIAGPNMRDTADKRSATPWYEDRPLRDDSGNQWRYQEYSVSIQAGMLYTLNALAAVDANPPGGQTPVEFAVVQPAHGDYVTGDVKIFARQQGLLDDAAYTFGGSAGAFSPMTESGGLYSAVVNVDSADVLSTQRVTIRGEEPSGGYTYSVAHFTKATDLPAVNTPLLYDDFDGNGTWGSGGSEWVNWFNQNGGSGGFGYADVDGRKVGKFTQNPAGSNSWAKFEPWHDVVDLSGYRYLTVTMKNPGYADTRIRLQIKDADSTHALGGTAWIDVPTTWTTYNFDLDAIAGFDKREAHIMLWLKQESGAYGEMLIDDITGTNALSGTAPTLTAAGVAPADGDEDDAFEFQATYTDADNQAPYRVQLVVDGVVRDMAETDALDTNFADGKTYSFSTKLPAGSHSYYFRTSDTTSDVVRTSVIAGPNVAVATSGPVNKALTATINSSSFFSTSFLPNFAKDGLTTTKWRSKNIVETHTIRLDLGSSQTVSRVVLRHAGAGGESVDLNTRDFIVETSANGSAYATQDAVTGNASDVTVHDFAPVSARYVRISIADPTNTSDNSARLYEFEVYE